MFPAQAGAELIQDLYASGVIVPTIDFTSIAEGSFLPEPLQQAWDFSTGNAEIQNTTTTLITTPGFWLVDLTCQMHSDTAAKFCEVRVTDGFTNKRVWRLSLPAYGSFNAPFITESERFVVFLRTGDSLIGQSSANGQIIDIWYRQIASVNGVLVNPLGFSF